jgi:hypothetical protein
LNGIWSWDKVAIMKALLILAAIGASAFGQVPAHSVSGGVTLDVADISLPVSYGAAENRAVFSACTATPVSSLAFTIDYEGAPIPFYLQVWSVAKTDNGYCTSIVAPVARNKIASIVVDQVSTVEITASPAQPSSSANSSAKRERRRQ